MEKIKHTSKGAAGKGDYFYRIPSFTMIDLPLTIKDFKVGQKVNRNGQHGVIKDVLPGKAGDDDYIGVDWDTGGYCLTPNLEDFELVDEFDRLVAESSQEAIEPPKSEPYCKGKMFGHSWVTYTGLLEIWDYCEKCDVKRDEIEIPTWSSDT